MGVLKEPKHKHKVSQKITSTDAIKVAQFENQKGLTFNQMTHMWEVFQMFSMIYTRNECQVQTLLTSKYRVQSFYAFAAVPFGCR